MTFGPKPRAFPLNFQNFQKYKRRVWCHCTKFEQTNDKRAEDALQTKEPTHFLCHII